MHSGLECLQTWPQIKIYIFLIRWQNLLKISSSGYPVSIDTIFILICVTGACVLHVELCAGFMFTLGKKCGCFGQLLFLHKLQLSYNGASIWG
jgi:hypothetical protein